MTFSALANRSHWFCAGHRPGKKSFGSRCACGILHQRGGGLSVGGSFGDFKGIVPAEWRYHEFSYSISFSFCPFSIPEVWWSSFPYPCLRKSHLPGRWTCYRRSWRWASYGSIQESRSRWVGFSWTFAIMHVCVGFQDTYVINGPVNSIHCHIDQHLDFKFLRHASSSNLQAKYCLKSSPDRIFTLCGCTKLEVYSRIARPRSKSIALPVISIYIYIHSILYARTHMYIFKSI